MAAKGYGLKDIRGLVLSCLCDGKIVNDVRLHGVKLTDLKVELLINFTRLILETSYVSDYSRYYYSHDIITGTDVYNRFKDTDSALNLKRVNNVMFRDLEKIRKSFGKDFVEQVLFKCNNEILDGYRVIIEDIRAKLLGIDDIRNNLMIEIPAGDKDCADISDEMFIQLLRALRPYSKAGIAKTLESLSVESCGYFHNLINRQSILTGKHKERFDALSTVLSKAP